MIRFKSTFQKIINLQVYFRYGIMESLNAFHNGMVLNCTIASPSLHKPTDDMVVFIF